jgi:cation diffusion facilitator family transporter
MAHAIESSGGGGNYARKQRTVLVSLITDFILWIPDIVAAVLSGSVVLFADAVKVANEILATFFSYLTIRRMAKGSAGRYDYGMGKMETTTSIITGGVMLVSLLLVFFVGIYRIAMPAELVHEGVLLGISLMVIGTSTNTWRWKKNYRLNKKEPSPIMDSQWRLYKTKAISDFSIFVSLLASLTFRHYAWSLYIDPLASFIIAGFLLTSSHRVISSSLPDLLDRTLDEELQLIIVRDLAVFFNDYTALHEVRSRRSGNNVYIELYLEFDGEKRMCEVQETINRIKSSLEANISKSSVSVVPTSAPCRVPRAVTILGSGDDPETSSGS